MLGDDEDASGLRRADDRTKAASRKEIDQDRYLDCEYCNEKMLPEMPAAIVARGEVGYDGGFEEGEQEVYHPDCLLESAYEEWARRTAEPVKSVGEEHGTE